MLHVSFRLRASADIQQVLRAGKRIHIPFAAVYILVPSPAKQTRITCVVGKRVHKTSVVRHAVQRKLRAAASALPLKQDEPYDMVIVGLSAQVRMMTNEEITKHILHAIQTTINSQAHSVVSDSRVSDRKKGMPL